MVEKKYQAKPYLEDMGEIILFSPEKKTSLAYDGVFVWTCKSEIPSEYFGHHMRIREREQLEKLLDGKFVSFTD